MSASIIAALLFTVALLVTKAYFLLGSIPLLTLKHDTPSDARFVCGFFNVYYLAEAVTAAAAAISFACADRLGVAAGAAVLVVIAVALRKTLLPRMGLLGRQILSNDGAQAVSMFRRVHGMALLVNVVQLAVIVWSLLVLSR